MGFVEEVTKLYNEEINSQVNDKLTKFAEHVSKSYDVNHRQLLRDLNNIDGLEISTQTSPGVPGQCLGIKLDGKRCSRKGKNQGYCTLHINQRPVIKKTPSAHKMEIELQELPKHNHSFPPLFSADCPACIRESRNKKKSKKIDL
jgi:hypothetical protein